MILDKKLQLASNMSIGTGARDFAGCKTSTDKISVNALRNFGLGEPVFLCVTVKQDFTVSGTSYIGMSLCAEHISDIATITVAGTAIPATGVLFHRLQPKLAFSGFVPGNFDSNTKNFVAGKKYIFPIAGLTAKYTNYPVFVAGYGGTYDGNRDVYFVFEEANGADLSPASDITSGVIDVDIVTLAEAGAGPGFNDQMCYPSSIKVQ
jgi:hypothetical protein